jgi:hypothetical protein
MSAIADEVARDTPESPMLFGRFRTWLVMVGVVVVLARRAG